jgi:hypothetical protein
MTMERTERTEQKRGLISTMAIVLLSWCAAAVLVVSAGRELNPASPAVAVAKVGAIIIVAFVYMKFATREVSLDHALFVGVIWLSLVIIAELAMSAHLRHGWFELMGSPARAVLRNLLLVTWMAAPSLFARRIE